MMEPQLRAYVRWNFEDQNAQVKFPALIGLLIGLPIVIFERMEHLDDGSREYLVKKHSVELDRHNSWVVRSSWKNKKLGLWEV